MAIAIYPQDCRDFSTNGLGLLTPIECSVTAELNGAFELKVVQPIDDTLRWAQLETGCIVKAPVPVRDSPVYEEVEEPETAAITHRNRSACAQVPAAPGESFGFQPGLVALAEGSSATAITHRKIYKVHNTSVGVYMRSGPGRSYKNYGYLKNGAEVVLLEITNSSWYHVCVVKGGRECYMASKYLTYDRTESETVSNGKITGKRVVRPMQAQEQLFRVYKVEPDSEAGTATASARHIFYDLMCDVIEGECELENVGFAEAVQTVWSKRMNPDDGFALRVLPGDYGSVSGDYGWRNPVEALLDGEDGLIAQGGALLVLDNYNIYLLPDAPRYSGVSIRRGKQLSGVKVTMNSDSVVTRVVPCGKDKDDKELLLEGTKYVDSPHIGDYPFPRVKKIDYDVKVASKAKDADGEKTFKTVAAAREKLAALAAAEFSENGLDAPEYGLKVDFLPLENTAEYADYAALQALFLGDTVDVVDSLVRVRARLRVTGYGDWNAVTRRYGSLTLGEVESAERTVYGSQIPNGSVSGSKLIPGSVTGGMLRNMTVEYAKISTAAIEQLSADAITALIGRFGEISTGKLTADALYTAYGEMLKLVATEITADNIETDELAAELARITVLIAGTAAFDAATIRHLVAEAMNLEYGVAGQVFIKNLAVEYAQMVGATIGNLCIRASDGKYYLLDVGADGSVTAAETTVTDGEIEAGQTSGGSVIVETNMTVANLNTTNLLGTYALINKIDAARIDVDELVARSVFADALYTSAIYGGKSLKVWVDELSDADIHDGATPPETAGTGKKWLDRGVVPSQLRRWKGLATTPLGNAMTTAREVEETAGGTSVSLDNSGGQINSALAVSVRGKNLLDIYALCNGISYVQGGTIGKWPENGGFDLTATANDCYTEPWNGANYDIPVKPNTTYTLSWDIYIVPNTGTSTVMYFIDHRFETGYYGQAAYDTHTLTFTTPSDAQTVSFRFGVQNSGESVGYANLQLEEGDARTAFSAYKTAATVTHNGTVYTLPLSNDADHDTAIEIEPLSGTNTISTTADAMEVIYTCSGWETIGDMSALQKTVDAQTLQAAALENAMNETSRLAEETAANFKRVIEIQSGADGGLIVGDNLSNCSIKIKSASIELRVGNTAVATYAQDYVRLQDMQIRVPAGVGGLVLSKFDKE